MKIIIYITAGIGGVVGSYLPVMFGSSNPFSGWSLLCGFIGTIAGIVIGIKFGNFLEG
jgi:hypothetical protein